MLRMRDGRSNEGYAVTAADAVHEIKHNCCAIGACDGFTDEVEVHSLRCGHESQGRVALSF
jgi:hypothetical protein